MQLYNLADKLDNETYTQIEMRDWNIQMKGDFLSDKKLTKSL
mgnify:CR=1 FL=1